MKISHAGRRTPVLRLASYSGGVAGAALVILGIAYSGSHVGSGTAYAGSGASSNSTYVQPTVGAANMGATATWTTPSSLLPTPMAVPAKLGS